MFDSIKKIKDKKSRKMLEYLSYGFEGEGERLFDFLVHLAHVVGEGGNITSHGYTTTVQPSHGEWEATLVVVGRQDGKFSAVLIWATICGKAEVVLDGMFGPDRGSSLADAVIKAVRDHTTKIGWHTPVDF